MIYLDTNVCFWQEQERLRKLEEEERRQKEEEESYRDAEIHKEVFINYNM